MVNGTEQLRSGWVWSFEGGIRFFLRHVSIAQAHRYEASVADRKAVHFGERTHDIHVKSSGSKFPPPMVFSIVKMDGSRSIVRKRCVLKQNDPINRTQYRIAPLL